MLAVFMEGPTSGELGRPTACNRREARLPPDAAWAGCFCGRPDLGARLLAFEAGLRPAIAARAHLPQGTVRAGCFCGRPDLGARLLAFEAGLRPAIAAGARLPPGTVRAGCFCGRPDLGARLFEAFCEEIHFHQARGRTGFDQRSRR